MVGIKRQTDYSQQITGFPVIFLKGGDSDYIPSRDFKDILNVFPAAEIIEVPGAGHWIQADKPEEVVMYIKKLLL
jgi:pimeloyl-ACP methyl ester carboxylesterase